MKIGNEIKLEKYIPVRKQLKAVNKPNICQKQAANDSQSGDKPTLPEAA